MVILTCHSHQTHIHMFTKRWSGSLCMAQKTRDTHKQVLMTALASLLIDSKEMGSGTHFSHAWGVNGYYRLIFIAASCLPPKNPRKAAACCLLSITLVILSTPSSWNHRKKNCGVTFFLLSGNQSSADEPSVLWPYHSTDLPPSPDTNHTSCGVYPFLSASHVFGHQHRPNHPFL